jgi:hypothetical protein
MARPVRERFVEDGIMVCINLSGLKADALAKMDTPLDAMREFTTSVLQQSHENAKSRQPFGQRLSFRCETTVRVSVVIKLVFASSSALL